MCGNENCVPFGCDVGEALEMLGPMIIWPVLTAVLVTGIILGVVLCKVLSKRPTHEPPQDKGKVA